MSIKGLWPVWPDHLTIVLSGTVTTSLPLVIDPNVELANTIELELYNELYNGGDHDFEELDMEEDGLGLDNMYKVTAVMVIPDWKEMLGSGGHQPQLLLDLSTLIGQDQYAQVVAGLQQACRKHP